MDKDDCFPVYIVVIISCLFYYLSPFSLMHFYHLHFVS